MKYYDLIPLSGLQKTGKNLPKASGGIALYFMTTHNKIL